MSSCMLTSSAWYGLGQTTGGSRNRRARNGSVKWALPAASPRARNEAAAMGCRTRNESGGTLVARNGGTRVRDEDGRGGQGRGQGQAAEVRGTEGKGLAPRPRRLVLVRVLVLPSSGRGRGQARRCWLSLPSIGNEEKMGGLRAPPPWRGLSSPVRDEVAFVGRSDARDAVVAGDGREAA